GDGQRAPTAQRDGAPAVAGRTVRGGRGIDGLRRGPDGADPRARRRQPVSRALVVAGTRRSAADRGGLLLGGRRQRPVEQRLARGRTPRLTLARRGSSRGIPALGSLPRTDRR